MSYKHSPFTSASNSGCGTASNETITRSDRRARMEAIRAKNQAIMEATRHELVEHEREIAQIHEERQKKHPDIVLPTFDEMKEVIELSKTISVEMDSARDMVARHKAYISSGFIPVASEEGVEAVQ
jgi:hypothetical protein